MANNPSIGSTRDFLVTSEGRAAAWAEASCRCTHEVQGGLIVCPKCGTAWQLARWAQTTFEHKGA